MRTSIQITTFLLPPIKCQLPNITAFLEVQHHNILCYIDSNFALRQRYAAFPLKQRTMSDLVIVDFHDISDASKDLTAELERAFGGRLSSSSDRSDVASPLGIIAIRNIPNFVEAKNALLPMAHALAHLKPEYHKALEDPTSLYNSGWSHGKEKLGDEPDFAKASYYFNPLTDVPGTPEEREKYPASYPCNKWPNEDELPQLKHFKQSAQNLGKIMHQTVVYVAKHIDAMVAKKVAGYRKNLLFDAMQHTEKAKGRLLYYYPIDEDRTATKDDNWIAWHNDSGFLTSLAGVLFLDDETGQPLSLDQLDPEAGLYVTNRSGESIHVKIPEDCMAVQIGECVQILTGGVVVATPHCVRGPRPRADCGTSGVKVSRISCPCFIDSKPSFPLTLPEGCTSDNACQVGIGRDKVPLLEERWVENGMSFGSFLQKSFEKYYDWSS
jgi:isopenicillin N synthase-like dioxygenase